MDTLRTFALDAEYVRLIAGGTVLALLLASVSVNLWILQRLHGLDARQRDIAKRLGQRTDRRDLATVAVAAAVLTEQGKEINREDVEAQVDSLLQNWARIEDTVDEVSRKLEDIVPVDRET